MKEKKETQDTNKEEEKANTLTARRKLKINYALPPKKQSLFKVPFELTLELLALCFLSNCQAV